MSLFGKPPDVPAYSPDNASKLTREELERQQVPYRKGHPESQAAAKRMRPNVSAVERRVLAFIEGAGARGATCDEVEAAVQLRHQTCSARFTKMSKAGRIVQGGTRRVTRSGAYARVWVTPRWFEVAQVRRAKMIEEQQA